MFLVRSVLLVAVTGHRRNTEAAARSPGPEEALAKSDSHPAPDQRSGSHAATLKRAIRCLQHRGSSVLFSRAESAESVFQIPT